MAAIKLPSTEKLEFEYGEEAILLARFGLLAPSILRCRNQKERFFEQNRFFWCKVLVEPSLAKKKPLRVGANENSILREIICITKFSFKELSEPWCDDEKPMFLIKQEFSFCLFALNRARIFVRKRVGSQKVIIVKGNFGFLRSWGFQQDSNFVNSGNQAKAKNSGGRLCNQKSIQ